MPDRKWWGNDYLYPSSGDLRRLVLRQKQTNKQPNK